MKQSHCFTPGNILKIHTFHDSWSVSWAYLMEKDNNLQSSQYSCQINEVEQKIQYSHPDIQYKSKSSL